MTERNLSQAAKKLLTVFMLLEYGNDVSRRRVWCLYANHRHDCDISAPGLADVSLTGLPSQPGSSASAGSELVACGPRAESGTLETGQNGSKRGLCGAVRGQRAAH